MSSHLWLLLSQRSDLNSHPLLGVISVDDHLDMLANLSKANRIV